MQRWWFLDNKKTATGPPSDYIIPPKSEEVNSGERQWTFRVLVTQSLNQFEGIAVTGECAALGNWIPQHCLFLNQKDSNIYFLK